MAEYFSHDYNARNDPKLQEVLMDMGLAGIGAYWCIVEMLYEQGGTLALKDSKSIAFSLHTAQEDIYSLITNYGLFATDEQSFWSPSIKKRIDARNEVRRKLSEAGKNGMAKRWNRDKDTLQNTATLSDQDNHVITTLSDQDNHVITIKENKSKENKSKDSNIDIVCGANTPQTINNRLDSFYDSLVPYVQRYGAAMIREFYDYWSEPNKSKTKMRYEREPTWDLSRRLARWARNKQSYNNKHGNKDKDERQRNATLQAMQIIASQPDDKVDDNIW